MRDNITHAETAPELDYREHAGGITSERVHPSGAIRCIGTDDEGYMVTMVYMGYTRREAVKLFRQDMQDYWERVAKVMG